MSDTTHPYDRLEPEDPSGDSAAPARRQDRPARTADVFAAHRARARRGGSAPAPERIRHFRIQRVIGEGGMGVVRLGWDELLGRPVAIKSLPPAVSQTPQLVEALTAEARKLAALSHPHIGAIYGLEVCEETHAVHLILQFIEGVTIADRLEKTPFSIDETLRIGAQVAAALEYAHERRFIHRDLKPSNVMIDAIGSATVLDFGIAVSTHGDRSHFGVRVGTPRYMSPEQIRGEDPDAKWDIWAFGCLLFELATGHPAFALRRSEELSRILTEAPPLQRLPQSTPSALEDLIRECLEKSPDRRPSSFREIRERLEAIERERFGPSETPARGRCRALTPRLTLRDLLPIHVMVRDEPGLRATLEFDADSWQSTDGPTSSQIHLRTGSGLHHLRPLRVGPLATPMLRLSTGGDIEEIRSTPPEVIVRDAEPDLDFLATSSIERVLGHDPSVEPAWGSWFAFRGPEGSGRSTLREALVRTLRTRGFRVLLASGSRSGRVEHKILHDLIRSALGVVEAEHTSHSLARVAREQLDDLLGPGATETRYFVDLLLRRPEADRESTRRDHHWGRLLGAIAREAPIALVIENLDSVPGDVRSLITDVLQRCFESSLDVLAVSTVTDTHELEGIVELQPPDIDSTTVAKILERLYPGAQYRDYYPTLVDQIVARAVPHVGVAIDLCRSLGAHDSGLFEPDTNGGFVTIPNRSPAQLLEQRLEASSSASELRDELTTESQPILEFAALMGVEFPVGPLLELGFEPALIDDALDALERAGSVHPLDERLDRYRFDDPRVPAILRTDLDARGSRAAARKRRQLAEVLAAREPNDSESAEWLGSVLIELGEPRRGVQLLLSELRARTAQASYESANALLPQLQRAFERFGPADAEQALTWEIERVTIALARRRPEAAKTALERALTLTDQVTDAELHARTLLLRARVETEAGQYGEADRSLSQAEAICRERGAPEALTLDVGVNRAVILNRSGRLEEARAVLTDNLRCFGEEQHPLGYARSSLNLGFVCHRLGRADEAREHFQTAHRIARRLDQSELETQAFVWLCNLDFFDGRFDDARHGYEMAIERFRQVQNRLALARAHYNLAEVETITGRLDRGIEGFRRAIDIAQRSQLAADEQRYRVALAKVLADCDAPREALRELERARELAGSPGCLYDHYALDAYTIGVDAASAPLDRRRLERELERWSGTGDHACECAGWLWIAALRGTNSGVDLDERALIEVGHRLREHSLLLPLLLRVIAEGSRTLLARESGAELLDSISDRIERGWLPFGTDLYALARANFAGDDRERKGWLDRATAEQEAMAERITHETVQASWTAERARLHERIARPTRPSEGARR